MRNTLNTKNIFLIVTTIFCISLFLFHFVAPTFIVKIKNPIVEQLKPSKKYPTSDSNKITLNTSDGLTIVGIHGKSKIEKRGSVILLHGIRGGKEHFKKTSEFLNNNGYDTYYFDSRGHGDSGGKYCTFGYREKHDVSAIVDYIYNNFDDKNISIWGQSLGGAIAIQALANDKRINAGVVESTFSNFRTIVHDYAKDLVGIEIPVMTNYLIDRAGEIADFDPDNINPFRDCENISQPMFIVHGNADEKININYGVRIFNNIKTEKKEFLEIESAGHFDIWEKGGTEYFEKVLKFLDESNH